VQFKRIWSNEVPEIKDSEGMDHIDSRINQFPTEQHILQAYRNYIDRLKDRDRGHGYLVMVMLLLVMVHNNRNQAHGLTSTLRWRRKTMQRSYPSSVILIRVSSQTTHGRLHTVAAGMVVVVIVMVILFLLLLLLIIVPLPIPPSILVIP